MLITIVVSVTVSLVLSGTVGLYLISVYLSQQGVSNAACQLSFAPMLSLDSGAGPMAVRAADLNKDNFLDLVVANHDSGTTSVFLGYGNGTFQKRIDLSNGANAGTNGVQISDVNGDDHLDIVVVNRNSGSVGIFLGHGSGRFTPQIAFSTGSNSSPAGLALHDLNNDMNLDLVVTDHVNNRLFVYLGEGNGSFSQIQTLNTAQDSGPYLVIVNDLNRDNQMDIAVGNGDGNLLDIFYGNGRGYFSPQVSYQIEGGPYALVAGDFDHDGNLDIATGNYYGNDTSILLATPQGGFRQAYRFSTGTDSLPYAIAMGDFNGDRTQDLIFPNSGTNNVAVLLGSLGGRFQDAKIFSTGIGSSPVDVAVADLNNDRRLDFISANNAIGTIGIFFSTCA